MKSRFIRIVSHSSYAGKFVFHFFIKKQTADAESKRKKLFANRVRTKAAYYDRNADKRCKTSYQISYEI